MENASRASLSRTQHDDYPPVHCQNCDEWKFAMPRSSERKIDPLPKSTLLIVTQFVIRLGQFFIQVAEMQCARFKSCSRHHVQSHLKARRPFLEGSTSSLHCRATVGSSKGGQSSNQKAQHPSLTCCRLSSCLKIVLKIRVATSD